MTMIYILPRLLLKLGTLPPLLKVEVWNECSRSKVWIQENNLILKTNHYFMCWISKILLQRNIRFEPRKPQKSVQKSRQRGAAPLSQFSHFIKRGDTTKRFLQNRFCLGYLFLDLPQFVSCTNYNISSPFSRIPPFTSSFDLLWFN